MMTQHLFNVGPSSAMLAHKQALSQRLVFGEYILKLSPGSARLKYMRFLEMKLC